LAIRHAFVRERTTVSNAHEAPATPILSRRNVLLGAATVGVGGAVVSVASLSEAFDTPLSTSDSEAIVVHVRDVKAGRLDVFAGDRRIEIRNRDLAEELAKAARRK
jgi:hypothetical protein